jgi:uncharacterized protein (DUF924 family)
MGTPVEVLDFWLGEVGEDRWYNGGDAVDDACRDRFAELCVAAREGGLEHWIDGPAATLAYLLLTDQLPRNIWRGTALAFASDARALAAARVALESGWDMAVPEPEREFFYLPFEHSENLADQELAVELMATRVTHPDNALHARAHRAVIARFGRFPTRNDALGRATTADEAAWLADGGYMAEVRRLQQP